MKTPRNRISTIKMSRREGSRAALKSMSELTIRTATKRKRKKTSSAGGRHCTAMAGRRVFARSAGDRRCAAMAGGRVFARSAGGRRCAAMAERSVFARSSHGRRKRQCKECHGPSPSSVSVSARGGTARPFLRRGRSLPRGCRCGSAHDGGRCCERRPERGIEKLPPPSPLFLRSLPLPPSLPLFFSLACEGRRKYNQLFVLFSFRFPLTPCFFARFTERRASESPSEQVASLRVSRKFVARFTE